MTTQRRKLGVKPRGACKKHSPPPKKRANASIASRPKLKRREDCSQMPNAASRRRARTYGNADVLKQIGSQKAYCTSAFPIHRLLLCLNPDTRDHSFGNDRDFFRRRTSWQTCWTETTKKRLKPSKALPSSLRSNHDSCSCLERSIIRWPGRPASV